MSLAQLRANSYPLHLNPNFVFRFEGAQATSDTSGRINNVWNLETLRKNKADTKEGVEIDVREPRYYPDSEAQIMVYVNGVFQESDLDFTLTAHSSSADCTVTFLKDIDAADRVTFVL